ncbi:MAG: lipoyl synthase [Candidatus Eisenbacteria bacterium]|nr:lipoyl synthase [Candidatus Eisenbacteria bacterium]
MATDQDILPKPSWLKTPLPSGPNTARVRATLHSQELHTVCEEARCPNIGKCFSAGEATFLILGKNCTRSCTFCNVGRGSPADPDPLEPEKILWAVRSLELKYVVITSPTRDDIPDGGAHHYYRVVTELKRAFGEETKVEVLVPDFLGNLDSVRKVLASCPDVFSHNMETVPRLYLRVRNGSSSERSLKVLERAKALGARFTKSGLMLGLGESIEEVLAVLNDLRDSRCDIVTIGQYLRPSRSHPPAAEYVFPEIFSELGNAARRMGFLAVSSGPLVRSSLDADELYEEALQSEPRGSQD